MESPEPPSSSLSLSSLLVARLAAGVLTTWSIVPFMKKARSGRSSCLPSRISLKPRMDSVIGTYTPGVPVNCSAT